MIRKHLKVGSCYAVKIGREITVARLEEICDAKYLRKDKHYRITNLVTGRETRAQSAGKFRHPIHPSMVAELVEIGKESRTRLGSLLNSVQALKDHHEIQKATDERLVLNRQRLMGGAPQQ